MVYKNLSPNQAIGIGFEINNQDANTLRLSDYDKSFLQNNF